MQRSPLTSKLFSMLLGLFQIVDGCVSDSLEVVYSQFYKNDELI